VSGRSLNWRGPVQDNTQYVTLDAVEQNGSSYIAKGAPNTADPNQKPVPDQYDQWDLMALGIGNLPVVTILPSTSNLPTGYECYFQADSETLWHFRFDRTLHDLDGYGWQFLGGPPIGVVDQTTTSLTASVSGAQAVTFNPLRGYFDVEFGALMSVATSGQTADLRLYQNGSYSFYKGRVATQTLTTTHVKLPGILGTTAGVNWDLRGVTSSGNGSMSDRWLSIKPIRCQRA
jgi:hypothetical protein